MLLYFPTPKTILTIFLQHKPHQRREISAPENNGSELRLNWLIDLKCTPIPGPGRLAYACRILLLIGPRAAAVFRGW